MEIKRREHGFPRFSILFGAIVSLIALVFTIVSVVIVARSEKTEVAAQVLSCGELTKYSAIAELKGHFTYAGEDIAHLWKITVKFINSGDKTIVGEGNQTNIIGEGLNFAFPDDTRLLNIENEANTVQNTIKQLDVNHFQVRFRQWRSGEYSIASFYVASDVPLAEDPLPEALTRDIIDGNIAIENLTERVSLARIAIIDRFPRPISVAGKITGGVSAGLLVVLFLVVFCWGWMDTIKMWTWKKRYLISFHSYLDQLKPQLSRIMKETYKKSPETLPDKLWANFEGSKASWSLNFDNKPTATIFTIILIFVIFGLSSLILLLFPL